MSLIKYTAKFKRPLTIMVNNKGKVGPMEVGEVQNFQQNPDGSLDIVAYIFPQVPPQLREQIEKNPQMLGMSAQTLPVSDHLVFPDGTKFDEMDNLEHVIIEGIMKDNIKLREDLNKLAALTERLAATVEKML